MKEKIESNGTLHATGSPSLVNRTESQLCAHGLYVYVIDTSKILFDIRLGHPMRAR